MRESLMSRCALPRKPGIFHLGLPTENFPAQGLCRAEKLVLAAAAAEATKFEITSHLRLESERAKYIYLIESKLVLFNSPKGHPDLWEPNRVRTQSVSQQ